MNYDQADRELTASQLDDKYNPDGDGSHPAYSRHVWRDAVCLGYTLLGYWDWVADQLTQED